MFARKGERFARWTDGKGRKRTAKVTTPSEGAHAGTERLLIEAATCTAKYRDGTGCVCKVATGCRSADAAQSVLSEREKRADRVRSPTGSTPHGTWRRRDVCRFRRGFRPMHRYSPCRPAWCGFSTAT